MIGIKDGKVWDIVSNLVNKRTADDGVELTKEELESVKYLDINLRDIMPGDTWDEVNNINLKDSPLRSIVPQKTPLELKIEELENRIIALESVRGLLNK